MSGSGRPASQFVEWTSQLSGDLEATFALTGDERVGMQGRRFLAGALSYSLQQLDIIPDHEAAGSVDDAIVLRIAYGLATEHAANAGVDDSARFARMTNDEDVIRSFLGDTLYAKVRRLVIDLTDKPVRGRTAEQIVVKGSARDDMKRELDAQAKRLKRAVVGDDDASQEAFEVSVKSWFSMKLI